MSARSQLLHLLRVPPRPQPPPGSPPRIFRAAPNFLKLRLIRWGFTQLLALAGLVWALSFLAVVEPRAPKWVAWLLVAGEIFGIAAFAIQLLFGWLLVVIDFDMRWYMLSDRAIRIREGVTTIREKTIALANVQNLAVRQGPLQRLLGIADVEVRTAGGGGGASEHEGKRPDEDPMHIALFRGVDNAEQIRDLVREGARLQRNAGLGDPDEHLVHPSLHPEDDLAAATAELLREARLLRVAAERR